MFYNKYSEPFKLKWKRANTAKDITFKCSDSNDIVEKFLKNMKHAIVKVFLKDHFHILKCVHHIIQIYFHLNANMGINIIPWDNMQSKQKHKKINRNITKKIVNKKQYHSASEFRSDSFTNIIKNFITACDQSYAMHFVS